MWLFTKYGFYSVVCARQGDGRHGRPVDSDRLMVRCRMRSQLEALQRRFPDLLGDLQIHESPDTDYAYRLFVEKSIWSQVLVGLNEELDFDNFKSAVARCQEPNAAYEQALHEVWSVMHRLQR
jgi:hypothetical protein